jgi:hypothetical protein
MVKRNNKNQKAAAIQKAAASQVPADKSPPPDKSPPADLARRAPTKNDVEALRIRANARKVDGAYSVGRTFIRGATIFGCFFLLYLCVAALAGKETTALLMAIVDLKLEAVLPWLGTATATGAWAWERRLRRKTIKELGTYTAALEAHQDPDRSRSGLLLTGAPRKEDTDAL